jgi:membrane protein
MKERNRLEAFKMVSNNLKEDHISESSAQCAYYVILSFIPFLILLLTLIKYINVDPQQLLDIVSSIIPENTKDMVLGIIEEAYSKSFGTLSISIIFTLFSADKGLFALTKGLHKIYNFSDHKNKPWIYLKLVSILQTALFIILVAVGLLVMVFGKTIIANIQDNLGALENYTWFSEIMTQLEMVIISFGIFLLIYKFMSRHKLNILKQVRGALFASIALNVVSYVFSKYLQIFRGFSTTYGSLTALILIMMWTYTVFYIIFLGAEINKFYYMESENEKGA